jgi:hypothetical protein
MASTTTGIPPQFGTGFLDWFWARRETAWATLPRQTPRVGCGVLLPDHNRLARPIEDGAGFNPFPLPPSPQLRNTARLRRHLGALPTASIPW